MYRLTPAGLIWYLLSFCEGLRKTSPSKLLIWYNVILQSTWTCLLIVHCVLLLATQSVGECEDRASIRPTSGRLCTSWRHRWPLSSTSIHTLLPTTLVALPEKKPTTASRQCWQSVLACYMCCGHSIDPCDTPCNLWTIHHHRDICVYSISSDSCFAFYK